MPYVIINPDSVVQSVAVGIAPADPLRAKAQVAHISRHPLHIPVNVPDDWATALKAEKSVDKDGKEVPAVIDWVEPEPPPPPEGTPQAHGAHAHAGGPGPNDMSVADLEKAGKLHKK